MSTQRFMVIVDPTLAADPGFERALQAARMCAASLHIYSCVCKPPFVAEGESVTQALERFQSDAGRVLADLAARAELDGVACTVELGCSTDFRQDMVQAAARAHADLVFKYSFEHGVAQREMRETADWMLMRLSPCPVLMVKNRRDWSTRRVLAAVNFASHDLAHIKLNNQIVAEAQRFAHAYGSEAHFVSAYADQNRAPDREEMARVCGVDVERMHLQQGAAASVIRDTAERIAADLILIGTVARSGLMGTVVGNTAERVLDETLSDVMVLN
jgi:universal stress protein E